jgi:hypothetical protein
MLSAMHKHAAVAKPGNPGPAHPHLYKVAQAAGLPYRGLAVRFCPASTATLGVWNLLFLWSFTQYRNPFPTLIFEP